MLYLALSLVVAALGLLALIEWQKARSGAVYTVAHLQSRVSQHLATGEWQTAEELLRVLRRKKGRDAATQALDIRLMRLRGRSDEAWERLREALLVNSGALCLKREEGMLLLEKEDAKGALDAFSRCRQLMRDPKDLTALANAYYQTGEVNAAWEVITPLLSGAPSGDLLALAGDCCFSRSDFEQALDYFRQAQKKGMSNQQILARMGHCLRRLGRFQEAERCFTAILQKDPANVAATLSLGACLEAQELHSRALLVYQHGKAWEAGDARILRQAGICAVHTDRYAFAELYLAKAMERGQLTAQVLAFFAYTMERQGKWQEAEETYLKLTEMHPDHVAGFRGIAWLYGVGLATQVEDFAGLQMARKSLDFVSDTIAWEMLSACEARAGNFDEAHHIQECLSSQDADRDTQLRRQRAMRVLRKRIPLDENLVARSLVA